MKIRMNIFAVNGKGPGLQQSEFSSQVNGSHN